MKFNPHKYQIEAANFLLDKPRSFLYLGLGLGKTVITLSTIRRLILTGESKGALVITPIRPMYNTWPDEIKKWDHLNSLTYTILHGEDKGKRLTGSKVNIYLINYEGLKWLEQILLKVSPQDIPFDILVFDESSMLKSNSAKRFKILKRLIHKTGTLFSRRYGLTGTPSPNSLQDIWSQFLLVDGGKRLGVSFTGFRDAYFYPLDFNGFKWATKYKAKENISNRVKDIVLRMRSEDYVDLPEKVDNKIVCDLPDDLRKQYKKLEKDFILQLTDNQEVTAFNAGVLAGKLRQFISGGMYLAHPEWLKIHNTKAEEVAQMIETYSAEPTLVAIQYKFEYDLMCDAMKRVLPVIYGDTKNKETNRLIDLWNKGLLPVLVVHPQSISHGVNLQSGGRMIFWLSLPWSYEQYTQLNGRLYRQGQVRSVIVNHMLIKNTIDERVYSTLIAKHNNEESFMKSLVGNLLT